MQDVKPVKNVIVMIPDGCSLATISLARWFQWYTDAEKEHLTLDPYICGTVRTSCSNAPIGDSAPTTSCYMTGYMSRAGWVSTYPTADPGNDIYPVDPSKAYQPLTTVPEAVKHLYGKSTGLVFTCEFPHATPADCSSHSYNRSKYEWIVPQQVANEVDVLIGGGTSLLLPEEESYLTARGWHVYRDDIAAMRTDTGNRMWALFCPNDMPYELDRNPQTQPSLAEMTAVAIDKLSSNDKGFFLMVEGSKVDWAAHNNDPASMAMDYLAFDEACRVAFDFAQRDGQTAVIMVPDHGNSGLSIGRRDMKQYARTPKHVFFENMTKFKASCDELAVKINEVPFDQVQDFFMEWCGFTLTDTELEALANCKEYTRSPVPEAQRKPVEGALYSTGLSRMIAQFMTERTGMAFTSNGHTGEEVLLAAYHPVRDSRPYGLLTNVELNHYICNLYGMTHDTLDSLTAEFFVPHQTLLAGKHYETRKTVVHGKETRELIINGRKGEMHIVPFGTQVSVWKKTGRNKDVTTHRLPSVTVYVDANDTFYLPRTILQWL